MEKLPFENPNFRGRHSVLEARQLRDFKGPAKRIIDFANSQGVASDLLKGTPLKFKLAPINFEKLNKNDPSPYNQTNVYLSYSPAVGFWVGIHPENERYSTNFAVNIGGEVTRYDDQVILNPQKMIVKKDGFYFRDADQIEDEATHAQKMAEQFIEALCRAGERIELKPRKDSPNRG